MPREGLDSALNGEGPSLDILAHFTEISAGYSPMWDVRLAEWTKEAISKDQRKLITDGDDLEAKSASGLLVSPAGGAGEDDGESGELSGRRLHQRIISWPHSAPPVRAGSAIGLSATDAYEHTEASAVAGHLPSDLRLQLARKMTKSSERRYIVELYLSYSCGS